MINRRLVLLLLASGALAAYAAWDDGGDVLKIFTGADTRSMPRPGMAAAVKQAVPAMKPAASLNPLSAITIESLSAIAERPLFNPTRAPAPKAVAQAEPVAVAAPAVAEETVDPQEFTLLAVSVSESNEVVMIRWNKTSEVFNLKKGEFVSGWQVSEVGLREITMARRDKSFQLKLFEALADAAGAGAVEPDETTNEPAPDPGPDQIQ